MSELQSHQREQIGSPRSFGLVFAAIFVLIGLWPLFAAWPGSAAESSLPRLWALLFAGGFALFAWLKPELLQPLNRLWFKFGELLGRIVTPIIMAILFFLVFTPIGLLLRLLGKDLLRLKLSADEDSYWLRRDKPEEKMGSMKNQF